MSVVSAATDSVLDLQTRLPSDPTGTAAEPTSTSPIIDLRSVLKLFQPVCEQVEQSW